MQDTPKFKTKRGLLTGYALACGYIQRHEQSVPGSKARRHVELWHEGGPCYHVRAYCFATNKRLFWDSFNKLTDARKRYAQAKRQLLSL